MDQKTDKAYATRLKDVSELKKLRWKRTWFNPMDANDSGKDQYLC